MSDTIEARFTTVLNTNERLKRELSAAKAEIARLREWKTAAENLIAAIRLDSGAAYPWPALDIADAALKPGTGELVDYVEFTDGTSLIGEEATAFYKGMACPHCGYRHPPDGMCV